MRLRKAGIKQDFACASYCICTAAKQCFKSSKFQRKKTTETPFCSVNQFTNSQQSQLAATS